MIPRIQVPSFQWLKTIEQQLSFIQIMAKKSRYILLYTHVRLLSPCSLLGLIRQSSTSTVSDRMDFWLSQNSRLIWCITSLFHNDTHQQIGDKTEKDRWTLETVWKKIHKWWSMLMLIVIEHDFHLFLKPASHAHGVHHFPLSLRRQRHLRWRHLRCGRRWRRVRVLSAA
jgi:hypothetical protein